jgi:hypothetical protein
MVFNTGCSNSNPGPPDLNTPCVIPPRSPGFEHGVFKSMYIDPISEHPVLNLTLAIP